MSWFLRRAGQALVTFLIATSLTFFLMRLTPGDPLSRLSEDRPMPAEAIADLRARYGLDQPLITQFTTFVTGVFRGQLGSSIEHNGQPVTRLIAQRLPLTLLLGSIVLVLNFTIGIALGVWQARRRGTAADQWTSRFILAAYAIPVFWLGLVLQWWIGVELRLLPTGGPANPLLPLNTGGWTWLVDRVQHLILPVLTLSLVTFAATARYQRAAMIEALGLDCVRTAQMKGLPERDVIWRHAWRNALGPVITLLGLWLPLLVSGTVFVESIFSWPGMGSLAWEAIGSRDYPVIMGTTILVAALVIGGNLLADALQRLADPRLRVS
jgi:peptide/nickel transport system permease protein